MALIVQDFIKPRKNTRPQFLLVDVRGIVVHYTATPKATALNERNYFNDGAGGRSASAHIFVDKNEARQVIPFNEVAYHANDHKCKIPALTATTKYYKQGDANLTTIGVEMCIEKDGSLHPDTVKRTVEVVAKLCATFNLTDKNIYRHYDITGKNCPAMWVDKPAEFISFKQSVKGKLSGETTATAPVEDAKAHVVAKDDTLYSIAKMYKLSVDELKSLNGLKTNTIHIGDRLIVKKPDATLYMLPEGVLRKGDRGSEVIKLQKALVAIKFYPDKEGKNFGIDGIFGKDTLNALTRFQKVYTPYLVDGIYGQQTKEKLNELLNK
ncbi:N-acetylmuramoyl-L-alanine amidase [Priestia megaterium]